MTLLATLALKDKALAKERPRAGKSGHFYTPKRTQEYEQTIRNAAIQQLPEGYEVPTAPVKLEILTVDEIPSSWTPQAQAAASMGRITPKRGDLDNRVKAILDALNGVYYVDDIQVAELHSKMLYGVESEVHVAVHKLEVTNWQKVKAFWVRTLNLVGSSDAKDNTSRVRVGKARDTRIPVRGKQGAPDG